MIGYITRCDYCEDKMCGGCPDAVSDALTADEMDALIDAMANGSQATEMLTQQG